MTGDAASAGDNRQIYESRQLKEIAARWDARAAAWDRDLQDPACHLNEDDAYNRFTRVALDLISQRRPFCASHGVIDAGCGTGVVLAAVCPSFAWGMGINISPEMTRAAQSKSIPRARFLVGDCFALSSLAPQAGAVLPRCAPFSLRPRTRPSHPRRRPFRPGSREAFFSLIF